MNWRLRSPKTKKEQHQWIRFICANNKNKSCSQLSRFDLNMRKNNDLRVIRWTRRDWNVNRWHCLLILRSNDVQEWFWLTQFGSSIRKNNGKNKIKSHNQNCGSFRLVAYQFYCTLALLVDYWFGLLLMNHKINVRILLTLTKIKAMRIHYKRDNRSVDCEFHFHCGIQNNFCLFMFSHWFEQFSLRLIYLANFFNPFSPSPKVTVTGWHIRTPTIPIYNSYCYFVWVCVAFLEEFFRNCMAFVWFEQWVLRNEYAGICSQLFITIIKIEVGCRKIQLNIKI